MPENEFPTISDFRDRLSELVEQGFGDLPAQVLVVPDSTLQAIGRTLHPSEDKPALMIDLAVEGRPMVGLISIDRLTGSGMLSQKTN